MNLYRNAAALALSAACALPALAQGSETTGQTSQAGPSAHTSAPNTQASRTEKRDDLDLGWLGLLGLAGLLGLRRREEDKRTDYRDNRRASTTP